MDKSEKSYYAVIGNKKRGKFSGAGPIQVAKKVASKKLKAGKEMEFYLDEVAGKKKRFGPYQARKDKKSGRVAVVKGRKVMRGGLLTPDDIEKLQNAFQQNREICLNEGQQLLRTPIRIIDIPFGFKTKPLIFFNLTKTKNKYANSDSGDKWKYKYAVFESKGFFFQFFENSDNQIIYSDFFDVYLKSFSKNLNNYHKIESNEILKSLIDGINGNNRKNSSGIKRILEKAQELKKFLESNKNSKTKIIYYTGESQKIQKCVYPDLTFGILDEKSIYNNGIIPICYNNYQIFLIMKKSFFGRFEPVIFLRKPTTSSDSELFFDVCIYEKDGQFHIITLNNKTSYGFLTESTNILKNNILILEYYCKTLQKIPEEFGRFQRLRAISAGILERLQNTSQQTSNKQSRLGTPPLRRNSESSIIYESHGNPVRYMNSSSTFSNLYKKGNKP